jgi:undecaprenyl diphosphate synthase
MQSTLHPRAPSGLHVGIIMDGNGRWAEAQGWPRSRGHVQGARVARAGVEGAPSLGIGVLSLYAFSSDNWKRPPSEVRSLMRLLRVYLRSETERCARNGVRVEVIGRRDRVPPVVAREMSATEGLTAGGDRLLLRLAIDYSGRDALVAAALAGPSSRREFEWNLDRATHARTPAADLDLLIRTGGERRLSDFMLWESAYAELIFSDLAWPAFSTESLADAVREYHRRDRRYGRVHEPARHAPLSPRPWPSARPAGDAGQSSLPTAALVHQPGR